MAIEVGDWVRVTHPAIKLEGFVTEERGKDVVIVEDPRFNPVKRMAIRRAILVAAAKPQTGLRIQRRRK